MPGPTFEDEIKNNSDPIDTLLEVAVNSKNLGPIDTAAELKRLLDEQKKNPEPPEPQDEQIEPPSPRL